jgi:hypothetical protein
MSDSTCLDAMYRFYEDVIAVFGKYYLREPKTKDISHLLSINESRGFPGMLGSIDFMHWKRKNCPFGWHGQYKGHQEGSMIILEVVASQDLRIRHSFFGMEGSNNDISVLPLSPVFSRLTECIASQISYVINSNPYDNGYY